MLLQVCWQSRAVIAAQGLPVHQGSAASASEPAFSATLLAQIVSIARGSCFPRWRCRYTEILKAMPLGLGLEEQKAEHAAADSNRRRKKRRGCQLVERVEVSVTSRCARTITSRVCEGGC